MSFSLINRSLVKVHITRALANVGTNISPTLNHSQTQGTNNTTLPSSILSQFSPLNTHVTHHPINNQQRFFSQKIHRMENRYNVEERRRLRRQKKGRRVFLPAYCSIRDFSKRIGVTMMMIHKAGSVFFSWWPRASARQLRRDGYSMLKDLVLRYDESSTLARRLGYFPDYEYTSVERIRNEHYARKLNLIPDNYITTGNGPRELPHELYPRNIQPKQPVVCIVGHVNHGKTTLLDALRGTDMAEKEAGLITQDMYSFQAYLGEDVVSQWGTSTEFSQTTAGRPKSNALLETPVETLQDVYKKITFLDTPGHASFYDMRENAVMYCDVSMLIVSAVEGVCSQTLESIEYIRAFNTPVMVVITKCDDPQARPRDVLRQLKATGLNMIEYTDRYVYNNLFPPEEEMDAQTNRRIKRANERKKPTKRQETPYICVSAKTGENMIDLRKTLFKIFMSVRPECDTEAPPVGMVVEGINEAGGRGRLLRILLSSGVIRRGDKFISGIFQGRVRDIRAYGIPTVEQEEEQAQAEALLLAAKNNLFLEANSESLSNSAITTTSSNKDNSLAVPSKATSLVTNAATGSNVIVRPNNKFLRYTGAQLEAAIPGVPLEVVGVESLPQAGDDFRIVPDKLIARFIAECRRLEVDYEDQARFRIAGVTPTAWNPPPSPDEMKLMSIEELQRAAELQSPDMLALSADGIGNSSLSNRPILDLDNDDDNDDYENDKFSDDDDFSDIDESDVDKNDDIFNNIRNNSSNNKTMTDVMTDDDDFIIDGNEDQDEVMKREKLGRYAFGDFDDTNTYVSDLDDEYDGDGSVTQTKSNAKAIASAWDAHWDVTDMDSESRHILIKAGTAGGLRMITDSIAAYNRRFPSRAIEITHSGIGRLTEDDIRRADNASEISFCPVFLYRTQKTHKKMLKKVDDYGVHLESHEVFDDLLKSIIGPTDFHKLFDEKQSLRPTTSPLASFKSNPLEVAPVLSLKELYEREIAQKEIKRQLQLEEKEKSRMKRTSLNNRPRAFLNTKMRKLMDKDMKRKDDLESDMDDMVTKAITMAMEKEYAEEMKNMTLSSVKQPETIAIDSSIPNTDHETEK